MNAILQKHRQGLKDLYFQMVRLDRFLASLEVMEGPTMTEALHSYQRPLGQIEKALRQCLDEVLHASHKMIGPDLTSILDPEGESNLDLTAEALRRQLQPLRIVIDQLEAALEDFEKAPGALQVRTFSGKDLIQLREELQQVESWCTLWVRRIVEGLAR